MLERVPASAESAAHLFLRNLDRPHQSKRALDPRFWQTTTPRSVSSSSTSTPSVSPSSSWWPQYLRRVREVAQTVSPSHVHEGLAAKDSSKRQKSRMPSHRGASAQLRRYTVTSATRHSSPQPESESQRHFVDPFFSDLSDQQEFPESLDTDSKQHGNLLPRTAIPSQSKYRPRAQNEYERGQENQENSSSKTSDEGSFLPLNRRSKPRPVSIIRDEDKFPNHRSVSLKDYNPYSDDFTGPPYRPLRRKDPTPGTPGDKRKSARLRLREEVATEENLRKISQEYQILLSNPIKRLPPRRDPDGVRLNDLISKQSAPTNVDMDQAWSLFIRLPDQEAHSAALFRYLAASTTERGISRALEAWRLTSRELRDHADYELAMNLELRLNQHRSAISVALEAGVLMTTYNFTLAQDLLLHFIRKKLWVSAAELLQRNASAEEDFAAFIAINHPDNSHETIEKVDRPTMNRLFHRLNQVSDRPEPYFRNTLNLSEWLRCEQSAYLEQEHRLLLMSLLQRLLTVFAKSHLVLSTASTAALLAMLDTHQLFPGLKIHNKVLDTLLADPNSYLCCESALIAYRNKRFVDPNARVIKSQLGKLLSACSKTNYDVSIYNLLLDEFRYFHGTPDERAYQLVLTACARQGRPDLVELHLQACLKDHDMKNLNLSYFSPLIYAHAVSGNVSAAEHQFKRIESEFGFKPNATCWNMLLLAHARSRHDLSAFDFMQKMEQSNVPVTSHTLGTLLGVASAHVDLDTALSLIQDAHRRGLTVTVPMLNALVEIYLALNQVPAAINVVRSISKAETDEPLARIWNCVLRYYANKGDVAGIARTRSEMQEYKVRPDDMSYAAVLAALVGRSQLTQAYEMLTAMHTDPTVSLKPIHYALVLSGFVRAGDRDMIVQVTEDMQRQAPRLSPSARAVVEILRRSRDISEDSHVHAGKLVVALLTEGNKFTPLDRKDPGEARNLSTVAKLYFDTFFQAMIQSRSFEAAQEVLKELRILQKDADALSSTGLQISLASMDLAIAKGSQSDLDCEWRRLFYKAQTAIHAETSLPGRMPKGWKTCLSRPLNKYMEGMANAGRLDDVSTFLHSVFERQGFVLTGRNINKYVQLLSLSHESKHRIRAFKVAEETLLNRAQNWELLRRNLYRQKTTHEFFSTDNNWARPLLDKRTSYSTIDRNKQIDLHQERLIPTYTTMVHLAAALATAQHGDQQGSYAEITRIGQVAPKTKKFVQQMPYGSDQVQNQVLRNRPFQKEIQFTSLARQGAVSASGSLLDQIPAEYLANVEQLLYPKRAKFKSLFGIDDDLDVSVTNGRADLELGEKFFGQINRGQAVLERRGKEVREEPIEMQRRIIDEERSLLHKIRVLRNEIQQRQIGRRSYSENLEGPIDQPSSTKRLNRDLPQLQTSVEARLRQMTFNPFTTRTANINFVEQKDESHHMYPRPVKALDFIERRRLRRQAALRQRRQVMAQITALGLHNFGERALLPRSAAARRQAFYERAKARRLAYLAYELKVKTGKQDIRPPKTERGLIRRLSSETAPGLVRFTTNLHRRGWRYAVRQGAINVPKTSRLSLIPRADDARFRFNFLQRGRLYGRVKRRVRFDYIRRFFGLPPKAQRVAVRGTRWKRYTEEQREMIMQRFKGLGYQYHHPLARVDKSADSTILSQTVLKRKPSRSHLIRNR